MSKKYRRRIIRRTYIYRPWHSQILGAGILLFIISILLIPQSIFSTIPSPQTSPEPSRSYSSNKSTTLLTSDTEDPNTTISTELTNTPLYKVTKVVDGDTIWINMDGINTKIRFIGIDAPESTNRIECYGQESSTYLSNLLKGAYVAIEYDSSQGLTDKYGRTLAYIYHNNLNLNLSLIQQGFAREYTYNIPYKYQSEFRAAEQNAKEQQRGLWSPSTCSGNR